MKNRYKILDAQGFVSEDGMYAAKCKGDGSADAEGKGGVPAGTPQRRQQTHGTPDQVLQTGVRLTDQQEAGGSMSRRGWPARGST